MSQLLVAQTIDISVKLAEDGSADIEEIWDISPDRGTEIYLVRTNLGEIKISDLRVSDETGREFLYEGEWDTNRSISEKEGKCGIVKRRDGVELCWGLGSYGHHIFIVNYHMTNVVEAMDDYDVFHLQLVSPGVQPRPQDVKVRIESEDYDLSVENSRIWAFGFDGRAEFEDGGIVALTEKAFTSDESSVIVLARFEKGMFKPLVKEEGRFEEKLNAAFEGSSYRKDSGNKALMTLMKIFIPLLWLLIIWGFKRSIRNRNRRLFGMDRLKDIGYERELPFNGNLPATRYILEKCWKQGSECSIASALILQMVKNGQIILSKDEKGKVLLAFNDGADLSNLGEAERKFYEMMREASGDDYILQDKEFSRWSKKNQKRVSDWVNSLGVAGQREIRKLGYIKNKDFTPEGQNHARRVIGFKKFLNDFTLVKERSSSEVSLWQDYIIYGALYGIADKVAKELKDIDPKVFEEAFGYDYPTMHRVLFLSKNMSNSIMNATVSQQAAAASAGMGGHSSFGGGGGFHGGGFGGGVR